jgi:acyl dehydratase
MSQAGLIRNRITDESVELMRRRIGYPSPTVRPGILVDPWNIVCTADSVRRYALSIGDDNPLYCDPGYARRSRWGEVIAPPGFEVSMGLRRDRVVPPELAETRRALSGVQLFHSGGESCFWAPIREGDVLYQSGWVADVKEKVSEFAGRSAIVTNEFSMWREDDSVAVTGSSWFVHAERRRVADDTGGGAPNADKAKPATYTDAEIAKIEATYDSQYNRGLDTLYMEDVQTGFKLPKMAKGPITITDEINAYMGSGWFGYGNPPYRLAYENRKKLRGFYTRDQFNNWDTLQRVHWDAGLAREVGLPNIYDIGPMRRAMVCHYISAWAGDDAWVQRIRYEFRKFNYMGDVTWLTGEVRAARVDEKLGPLIEISLVGTNQRGETNISAEAVILVNSRKHGPWRMPSAPPVTAFRSVEPPDPNWPGRKD